MWSSLSLEDLIIVESIFRYFFLLSEIVEYLKLPCDSDVQWLSSSNTVVWFFWTQNKIQIFLSKKATLNHYHGILSDFGISFCYRLGNIFFNESNLKLQSNTELICRIYTMVKSCQWQLTVSESQIMVSYFICFPCCQS